jgi:hypothetical protein
VSATLERLEQHYRAALTCVLRLQRAFGSGRLWGSDGPDINMAMWLEEHRDVLACALEDTLPPVREAVAALIEGSQPGKVSGGRKAEPRGANLTILRQIAAQVARQITAALPADVHPDKRRRAAGPYQGEVLDRTALIMCALYGLSFTPQDVRQALRTHQV